MTNAESVRVVFVGGTGRSGSTVVANALGALDDAVSVGEVRYLWERGIGENRLCGCGQAFADCPFWQEVLHTAYGTAVPDAGAVHAQLTVATKLPTYAALLAGTPGLDVDVVHLVRDPRAAAFSWQRKKAKNDQGGLMERRGVVKSATLWTAWNAGLERAWRGSPRYVRLRYESFATHPRQSLQVLADALALTGVDALVDEQGRVDLPTNHTVAGNPARMAIGPTPITLDNEWASAMDRREAGVVTALTSPLLGRYGYPRAVAAREPAELAGR